MSRASYTENQKKAFVLEWMQSNKPKSRWFQDAKDAGHIQGHYNSFDAWIKLYQHELEINPNFANTLGDIYATERQREALAATLQSVKVKPANIHSIGTSKNLLDEFQQTLLPDDVQKKYIEFLETKVNLLVIDINAIRSENEQLKAELEGLKKSNSE
ncbi:hypothetical protein ACIPZ5_17830 [Pseudomonas sp. NPDC089428]|uniref:hypothetical protein n=1 Tax=Pseudomonas sp. NPDC089428 TaxID=3364467 RepID=UPI0037FE52FA